MDDHPTKRVFLDEFTADDLDGVVSVYGDPAVTEHLSFEPRTVEQCAVLLDGWMASARATPRTEFCFAARLEASRELVGVVRIALDPHQQQAATVGFALAEHAWGQGLGAETLDTAQRFAFVDLGLHRLWAARAPLNTASEKTLVRAGFVQEGRIREHVLVRGSWRDSITYGSLATEWNLR